MAKKPVLVKDTATGGKLPPVEPPKPTVKSIDAQQLDRLLLSEEKKHHIRELLRLAPEARAFLHDGGIVIIQQIRVCGGTLYGPLC
jgi:hypothetical protein